MIFKYRRYSYQGSGGNAAGHKLILAGGCLPGAGIFRYPEKIVEDLAYVVDLGNWGCPDVPRKPDTPRKWDVWG
jgi:hypothetical protein